MNKVVRYLSLFTVLFSLFCFPDCMRIRSNRTIRLKS